MIPTPTPDQAVHVLKILGEWTKRGWRYESSPGVPGVDPRALILFRGDDHEWLHSYGVNHFDALCQATTVMQVLLEEFPGKP